MSRKGALRPADIVAAVRCLCDQKPGEWLTPHRLWHGLQWWDPELSEQVAATVATYQDPARCTAVWFVSNALYHLAKVPGYELSDTHAAPEAEAPGAWIVIRKAP